MTEIKLVPVASITFNDSERQRSEVLDVDDLVTSILKLRKINPISMGLLHPVILTNENKLLTGRRRLAAFLALSDTHIPARYFNDLALSEQKLVELDENLRRQDIDWKDRVRAIAQLHELLQSETYADTADYIGLSRSAVSQYLQVAEELSKSDPRILACTSINAAIALTGRRRQVALDSELAKIHEEVIAKPIIKDPGVLENLLTREPESIPGFSIQEENFLTWAPAYRGQKFNFIHCDFPYGIDFQDSAAGGSESSDSLYDDSEELFWKLTLCLTDNLPSITYESCHILFWFHMKYYTRLIDHFSALGLFVHNLPLIWQKSDGAGIASDYRRRPKHVYETALWLSRGDRFISNVVNDAHYCPSARASEGHLSAKPEPMLQHFLHMGVSEHTELLDPTCGSGTSIRAAFALGAQRAVGLEVNGSLAKHSQDKLQQALMLARAHGKNLL